MAVQIEFRDDESAIRYGEVPILLSINGISFLDWRPLSLASFATWGIAALRVAVKTGRAVLDLDEYGDSLFFKAEAGQITVFLDDDSPLTTTIEADTIIQSWTNFARNVQSLFRHHSKESSHGWWHLIEAYPPPRLARQLHDFSKAQPLR